MGMIKRGALRTLLSGVLLISDDDKIQLSFNRGDEKVTLIFLFEEGRTEACSASSGSGNDVRFTFYLPRKILTLGEGVLKPVEFASFDNGDKLYFSFWTRHLTDNFKEFIYNVYVGSNS